MHFQRLREELEAAYEEDLDEVFDVAAVRAALEQRLKSLESELHQVERLQRKFAMIHSTLAQQQSGKSDGTPNPSGGAPSAADTRILRDSQETLNPLSLARASTGSMPGGGIPASKSTAASIGLDPASKTAAKLAASLDLSKGSGRLAAIR